MNEKDYWVYIASAYGAAFAIVGFMIWRVVSDHWRLSAELKRLQDGEGSLK